MFHYMGDWCVISAIATMEAVGSYRIKHGENFLAEFIRAFARALTTEVCVVQSLVDGAPDGIGRVNRPADIHDPVQPLAPGPWPLASTVSSST